MNYLAALLLMLLAACASTPEPAAPARRHADALNARGVELHKAGELAEAARLFGQAQVQSQAIEYEDGIAQSLLNLARTRQALGQAQEADAVLASLLDGVPLAYSPARRAEALAQRTVLALARGDAAAAARWHADALQACGKDCALQATLLNLGARIALDRGDAREAQRRAEAALARHRAANNRIETANALRLLGAAALAQGDRAGAARALHEALAIDKALAHSDKIFQDLALLGHASEPDQRRAFWQRALQVAGAAGMRREQAELQARLDALSSSPSPSTTSP